jgi:hypothetical protein
MRLGLGSAALGDERMSSSIRSWVGRLVIVPAHDALNQNDERPDIRVRRAGRARKSRTKKLSHHVMLQKTVALVVGLYLIDITADFRILKTN